MLRKKVTYLDFNGNKQTDVLYFNLSEPEVIRLDVEFKGGLIEYVETLDPENDPQSVLTLFERVLGSSYGEKSADGKHFEKNDEMRNKFFQSAAYNELFMIMIKDADFAATFFNGILSESLAARADRENRVN